jgi:hypothetical protein
LTIMLNSHMGIKLINTVYLHKLECYDENKSNR